MKTQIHPNWYPNARVTCACGNTFTIGSTIPEIHVEVCSACHPFFTGKMKFIDTAGRVDRFRAKQEAAASKETLSKKERRALKRKGKIEEEISRPETLQALKTSKKS